MDYNYLVIEDDTNVWENIKQRMAAFPSWSPCGFSDEYDRALDIIQSQLPHLIFMDWSIIGGNAFDLLEEVEKIANYQPYIIFFTGYQSDMPEIPEILFNRYRLVQRYIVKPIQEKLTNHLAEYVQEAEKLAYDKTSGNFIWIEDYLRCKRRINPNDCIAILHETTIPRCKKILLYDSEPIFVRKTWEECVSFFERNHIKYFIANQRKSIVNVKYIREIQYLQIHLPKNEIIEVSRQQWKGLREMIPKWGGVKST